MKLPFILSLFWCMRTFGATEAQKAPRPPATNTPQEHTQEFTVAGNPILTQSQPRALTLATLQVTENVTVGGSITTDKITTNEITINNISGVGTSADVPHTLVLRDSTGSFAAGTLTATNAVLTGLPTMVSTGNVFIDEQGNLYVGLAGQSSGTSSNVPNTAVVRDSTGSFETQNMYLAGSLEPLAPSTVLDLGVNGAQTINVGNTTLTDTINIGAGGGLQVVNIGTGTGATVINLGSAGDVVNIGGTLTYVNVNNVAVADKLITLNASAGVATGFNSGIQIQEGSAFTGYLKTSGDRTSWLIGAPASYSSSSISFNPANIATLGVLHSDASGNISASLIVNADIATTAAITDSKLATLVSAGKVANTATTATSVNTANAIIARDPSGAFAAGTMTANQFVGTLAGSATGFSGALSGDVTGTQSATVVSKVGGATASSIAGATNIALSGTSTNTPGSLVLRDQTGSFAAGTVTANQFVGTLAGNASGFSGGLSGDVTGTQSATVVSKVGGATASSIAAATNVALSGTSTNTPGSLVLRDQTGSFAAGTVTANQFVGTLAGNASGFSGALSGDLTGTQSATVVSKVGGATASSIAAATNTALSGTSTNTPGTLVLRDQTGSFAAGTVTANQFVGTLNGNVTGLVNGATASSVAAATNVALSGTATNTPGTLVLRNAGGSFAAGTITATNAVLTGLPSSATSGNVYVDTVGNLYVGASGGGSTGTSTNTPNTVVLRDPSGSFAAGTITANQFVGTLNGNVTGFVNGVTAASVAAATNIALSGTSTNTPRTLVLRDPTGSFAAGTITAKQFVGTLNGNVTGFVNGVTASSVAAATNIALSGTSTDTRSTLVLRDPTGSFAAGTIKATNAVLTGLPATASSGNVYIDSAGNLYAAASGGGGSTGTSTNTPNTLVLRDASGSFSAGTINAADFNGSLVTTLSSIDLMKIPTGTLVGLNVAANLTSPAEYILVDTVIQDRYAYLLGVFYLYIVDISVPSAPVLVSVTPLTNFLSTTYYNTANLSPLSVLIFGKLSIQGSYLYITASSGDSDSTPMDVTTGFFASVDVSNVYAPVPVGLTTVSPTGLLTYGIGFNGLAVQGGFAYVPAWNRGNTLTSAYLYVFDVRQPAAPNPLKLIQLSAASIGTTHPQLLGCLAHDRYLYALGADTANNNAGFLLIFDLGDPSNPQLVSHYVTSANQHWTGLSQKMSIQGAYLFAPGMGIFDVSNPALPVLQTGAVNAGASAEFFVLAADRYVLFAQGYNGTQAAIYDLIGGPNSPVLVGTLTPSLGPTAVWQGRYLYSGVTTNFTVTDFSGDYIQSLECGSFETCNCAVRGDIMVSGDVNAAGAGAFGRGLNIRGASTFQNFPAGTLPALTLVGSSSAVPAFRLINLGSGSGTALVTDSSGDVWLNTSSKRFKENIRPLQPELVNKMYDLEPVTFDPAPGVGGPANQIGLIAEQVEPLFPQMVDHDAQGQVLSVQYPQLHALLIAAVQELRAEQRKLRAKVDELRAANQRIKKRLEA